MKESPLHLFPHIKAKMQVSILNVHKMFTYHGLSAMYQQASPFGDKRQVVGIIPSP